jgi:hypothetical protein
MITSVTSEETPFATYALVPPGMLVVRPKTKGLNTLEQAKTGVGILRKLAGSTHYPLLIDLANGGDLEAHARQYYAEQSMHFATRVAITTPSIVQRVAGNFFLATMASSRQPVPTRLFTGEEPAKTWLLAP